MSGGDRRISEPSTVSPLGQVLFSKVHAMSRPQLNQFFGFGKDSKKYYALNFNDWIPKSTRLSTVNEFSFPKISKACLVSILVFHGVMSNRWLRQH